MKLTKAAIDRAEEDAAELIGYTVLPGGHSHETAKKLLKFVDSVRTFYNDVKKDALKNTFGG